MIKTLANIQADINALYSQESDALASTDEDYVLRTVFINKAISDWQDEPGMLWKELLTDTAEDSTGAVLTIATGTTSYATPAVFNLFGGIYINLRNPDGTIKERVAVIERSEANALVSSGNTTPRAYVAGKPGSHRIVFSRIPSEWDGLTFDYPYYKHATALVEATDVSECPDADFLTYKCLAELHRPSRVALSTEYDNKATERMEDMMINNVMVSPGQVNSLNQNFSYLGMTGGSGGSIFG